MDTIVTRFAPSPTGHLHIGGVRTALINYILTNQAKKNNSNSKFLLRIEDTDKKRSKQEYVERIINGLEWLGINWDEDIYIQSKRIARHYEIAIKLLESKNAYKCICTPEQIIMQKKENLKKNLDIKHLCRNCEFDQHVQSLNKGYCIRIKIPKEEDVLIEDIIQGNITVKNKEIDNFIILRKDSTPTYMLSVVVDDHDMNVNMIIRGNDHLNNAFRQLQIYKKLEWKIPKYAHLPLIHGLDGVKLSKRHGSIDINEFKNQGYLPKAIINNLILLGWSPKKDNEILEMDEIIKIFNIKKMSKSSSIFDYKKLDFLNNFYIQKDNNYKDFEKYIKDHGLIKKYLNNNQEKIKVIFNAYKKKINRLFEFIEIIIIYFDINFASNNDKILNNNFKNILSKFILRLTILDDWNESNIEYCINNFIKDENIKFSKFGQPLRHLLTNNKDGISISLVMFILGRDLTFLRINNYIKK